MNRGVLYKASGSGCYFKFVADLAKQILCKIKQLDANETFLLLQL